MTSRPRILISEPIAEVGMEVLRANAECIADWGDGDIAEMFRRSRAVLPEVDAVVVRLLNIGEEEMRSAPRLRVIAKHGVGLDNIDCDAATRRKISVLWTPGANANAVAEHVIGLMIGLCRHFERGWQTIKNGLPFRRHELKGIEVAGRTLGIVGLGNVGSLVARKASLGLDMRVLVYDPYVTRDQRPYPVEFCDTLEELLSGCDLVTLHVPLTDQTRRMINTRTLQFLRPEAYLINTSRGAVIDESALVEALHQQRLAGAALDVFEEEPLPVGHPVALAPATLLSPHVGGMTHEALDRVSLRTARNVLALLEGKEPESLEDLVNPESLEQGSPRGADR
jgi:D-3-phosphoglycerate dehydrogenase